MEQEDLIEDFFKEVRSKYPDSVSIKGYLQKKHGTAFFADRTNVRKIIQPLLTYGLLTRIKATPDYVVCTENGAAEYSYKDYINDKSSEAIKEKEIAQLTHQKLKFDTANSKRIYGTYWITFALSVAGFVISIILLIFKLLGK